MRRSNLLFAICLVLLFGACRSHTTEPSDTVVFSAVVQEFLEVPVAPGTVNRILVLHPGQAEPADRSIVHISKSTNIARRSPSGEMVPATVEDIEVGQSALFRIESLELQSYPRQVFATRVEL